MKQHMITHSVVTNLCIYREGWAFIVGTKPRTGKILALPEAHYATYTAALARYQAEQQRQLA
jgi:hypothetical protein